MTIQSFPEQPNLCTGLGITEERYNALKKAIGPELADLTYQSLKKYGSLSKSWLIQKSIEYCETLEEAILMTQHTLLYIETLENDPKSQMFMQLGMALAQKQREREGAEIISQIKPDKDERS